MVAAALRRILKVIVFIGLYSSVAAAVADNYDDGLLAYSKGQFVEARSKLHQAAQLGEAGAYHLLAKLHSDGLGGKKDAAEALRWTSKAAEAGIADAQYQWGQHLSKKGDFSTAFHWFGLAGAQGHALAYFQQALLLSQNRVKDYNEDQMLHLYQVTALELDVHAQKGVAEAQYGLAYMYERGLGLLANPYQAVAWYQRAAQQGLLEAQFNLGRLLALADDGLQESVYWMTLAAKQGHKAAQEFLAAQGKSVAQIQ